MQARATVRDKEAKHAYDKAYRLQHKERIAAQQKAYRESHREALRELYRSHHATHREQEREYSRQYSALHREERLAYDKVYRATHAVQIAQRAKAYRASNIEKSRARVRRWATEHPEKIRAKDIRWNKENPERRSVYYQQYRARKRQAPMNDLTPKQWKSIKEHYGFRCVYCGKKQTALTMDHITPLSRGGSHTYSNIVPACRSCNSRKNDGNVLTPVQPLLLVL